ncbi:MAG: spore photoproduct lyase family protein [Planctomycetota bacterium]
MKACEHEGNGKYVLKPRKSPAIRLLWKGPKKTVCPNFNLFAHAGGCGLSPNCSYCFLKSSLSFLSKPVVYNNVAEMEGQVLHWIRRDDLVSYVLNTGNLSDSLAFEQARPFIGRIIELFREHAERPGRPHTLLIVTKGGMKHIRPLLEREPCPNVIVSFSVNCSEAAHDHEKGAPTPANRLNAAKTLMDQGWRVRIRIDPMIRGYEYSDLVEQVAELAPERVTLGLIRVERNLEGRIPEELMDGLVLAKGEDMRRYPAGERVAIFRPAVERLRNVCSVGLCEETPEVWDALRLDRENKTCNCNL